MEQNNERSCSLALQAGLLAMTDGENTFASHVIARSLRSKRRGNPKNIKKMK